MQGCSVIIKPAELCNKSCSNWKRSWDTRWSFKCTSGYGDVGEALGRHKDVDAVSFTGSTEVGGYFLKSSESNLKPV